jgi:hypothetical protein
MSGRGIPALSSTRTIGRGSLGLTTFVAHTHLRRGSRLRGSEGSASASPGASEHELVPRQRARRSSKAITPSVSVETTAFATEVGVAGHRHRPLLRDSPAAHEASARAGDVAGGDAVLSWCPRKLSPCGRAEPARRHEGRGPRPQGARLLRGRGRCPRRRAPPSKMDARRLRRRGLPLPRTAPQRRALQRAPYADWVATQPRDTAPVMSTILSLIGWEAVRREAQERLLAPRRADYGSNLHR